MSTYHCGHCTTTDFYCSPGDISLAQRKPRNLASIIWYPPLWKHVACPDGKCHPPPRNDIFVLISMSAIPANGGNNTIIDNNVDAIIDE